MCSIETHILSYKQKKALLAKLIASRALYVG